MQNFAISRLSLLRLLVGIGALVAAGTWALSRLPGYRAEMRFIEALRSENVRSAHELKLSELMPGDWEFVCGSNGYAGEFHVKRYNRTYPAVGALHDGAWGLVFIARDGSYTSAAGNCASPGIYLGVEGCIERTRAVLSSKSPPQQCARFAQNDG